MPNQTPHALADQALSLIGASAFSIHYDGGLSFASQQQASDVLGQSVHTLPKTIEAWCKHMEPDDIFTRRKALSRLSWDGAQYRLTYPWRTVEGERVWVEERGVRKSSREAGEFAIEGVFINVTQQKRKMDRKAFLTNHDGLTKIANGDRLLESLDHSIGLAKAGILNGYFTCFRLLNLADVNEIYGYEMGERLLVELAKRLSTKFSLPHKIGRIGETDFGVISFGGDQTVWLDLLQASVTSIAEAPVMSPHGEIALDIGLGVVEISSDTGSATQALSQSELALDDIKPSEIKFYKPVMGKGQLSQRQSVRSDDVLDALNQRRIRLAYQPIIDAKTRKIHHYECLLRLCREDGEIVSAGQFIMAAEKLGLVDLLDRRALELAAETLLSDPDVHLALNLSAATISNPETAEDYITALKSLGPAAERVTIELTETVALDDPEKASAFANEIRLIGCDFAIDDFGSGYTTFRNLMAIEAEMIKIDGSLIIGVAHDHNKQTFIRMMVDLAQTFSVQTVAEMVDDRADADMLCRLGVDYLQGFMFGIPSATAAWQRRAG